MCEYMSQNFIFLYPRYFSKLKYIRFNEQINTSKLTANTKVFGLYITTLKWGSKINKWVQRSTRTFWRRVIISLARNDTIISFIRKICIICTQHKQFRINPHLYLIMFSVVGGTRYYTCACLCKLYSTLAFEWYKIILSVVNI